jgi:hypothetical protein
MALEPREKREVTAFEPSNKRDRPNEGCPKNLTPSSYEEPPREPFPRAMTRPGNLRLRGMGLAPAANIVCARFRESRCERASASLELEGSEESHS